MNRNKILVSIFVVFGLVFCSISLVNHYNFRTYAWDLGLYNNALYDYAHFRYNDCMLLLPDHEHFKNYLSDHFSLLPILFSPLFWILGSNTLLVVQIASVLFGGYGVFLLVKKKTTVGSWLPVLALIHFFSIWGIYSALSYDYHDNVIAAMFVPLLIYFFECKKYTHAFLLLILILISKENMALWAVFICLGLVTFNLKDKKAMLVALLFSALSAIYFIIVIKIAIPALNVETGKEYFHFNYDAIGSNFEEAITTLITQPLYSIKLLFINHTSENGVDDLKINLHLLVLLSGGIFLLINPRFLLMLIPIYCQKMYNNEWSKWGPTNHYSIEFVPVLVIATYYSLAHLRNSRVQYVISIIVLILTVDATTKVFDGYGDPYFTGERIRFDKSYHYVRDFNVSEVHEGLSTIPDDAIVSAQTMVVPHLTSREFIYQFPYVTDDVNYIVLLDEGNLYPMSEHEYREKIVELKTSKKWKTLYDKNKLMIFKKKPNS